jgi:hypothetical protein
VLSFPRIFFSLQFENPKWKMKRQFLVPRVALRERGDDDVVVSRSSFPLVFFVFFFQTTVVSVSFSVPLCASSSFPPLLLSKEQRERERNARARRNQCT